MTYAQNTDQLTQQLQEAGVSENQIKLALETNGHLLELLASYPLDTNHRLDQKADDALVQLFEKYAASAHL